MKHFLKLFFLFLSALSLLSCSTTISGRVTEDGVGLPDTEIKLQSVQGSVYGDTYGEPSFTTTDSDGYYSMEVDIWMTSFGPIFWIIQPEKENYYFTPRSKEIGSDGPVNNVDFNATYSIPPVLGGDYYVKDDLDIEFLKPYTEIIGDLVIDDPYLQNFVGLEGLISIGGDLKIINSHRAKNLDGLNNLTSVGGSLVIEDNDALSSLGLSSLCSIEGDFYGTGNVELCTFLADELGIQVQDCGGISGSITITGNKDCSVP